MGQHLSIARASVVAGSFLLLASLLLGPIAEAAPQPSSYVLLADSSGFEATKQAYVDKARAAFDDWGRKIDAWSDEAKAKGSKVSDQARRQMDRTWTATKARWADLKAATADGWDKARHSYEEVTQKLGEEWHKLQASR
jgi:hypothetical protein